MNGAAPSLADRLGPMGGPGIAPMPGAPVHAARPPGSVSVYDVATGEERFEDPETATELFKAGKVNLIKGTRVGVVDPDGEIHESDTDDVSAKLADGATLVGDDVAHHAEVRRQYSGLGGGLLSAGIGAADAATLGNVSNAAGLFGEDAEEAVQAATEEHPYANMAGQLAGSLVMPGGAGARGLGAMAEGALAKEGAGLGRRLLAKGAEGLTSGAAYGGLAGLQNTLSEDAIHAGYDQQPDLTGEQIVAGIGHGAITGAILGGLTGAGIEGIATGAREASAALQPKLEKLANSEMWRGINSSKAVTKQAVARVEGGTEALGATARSLGLDDPRLGPQEQLAKTVAAKGETGSQIGDMYRRSGAMGTARELVKPLDELIAETSKIAGNERTVASLETYRASLIDKVSGEAPDATAGMGEKEAALFNEEKRLRDLGQHQRAGELQQIREAKWGVKAPVDALDAPIPLAEMWRQRIGLNRLVYQEAKALDPNLRVELLRSFSAKFQDYLEEAGEKAAAANGEEFAGPLRALNKRYQHLSLIEDTLEENVARNLTNRRYSLTDSIAGAGGGAGAVTAAMAGHPLVAAGLAAAGLGNKLLRERGPQTAAWMLGRVGSLETVAGHVQAIDGGIERAVSQLAAREAPPASGAFRVADSTKAVASAKREKHSSDEYEARAGTVRELASHPELAQGAAAQFAHLDDSAPKSAKAAAAATQAGVKYLAANLPAPVRLDPLQPEQTTPPSLSEQQKWLRRADAVNDPTVLFDQVKALRIDPLTVDAVRAVYPALFGKLADAVRTKVSEEPDKFDRRARQALSPLAGAPLTPSAAPAAFASRQAVYATPPQQGGMGPGSSGKTALSKRSTSAATASEQIAEGDGP